MSAQGGDEAGSDRTAFDAGGPLPSALVALEASAGTGKTYALSALATRFIAERQMSVSQLCVVTFTEAATAELRGRIRERISHTAEYLQHVLDNGDHGTDDPVLRAVADVAGALDPSAVLRDRLEALRRALAEFDTATIATIHGFCSRVLAGRGPEAQIVTSGAGQISEVAGDVILAAVGADPGFSVDPDRLTAAATQLLKMPDARLVAPYRGKDRSALKPKELADVERAERLMALATAIVDEVRRRRDERAQRTFDSLLSDVRDLLWGPEASLVIRSLRERYRLVLIDEFQDTDQIQWQIFNRAFVDAGVDQAERPTMVIVGDPKQSIYRFRSAEVSAYLDAVAASTRIQTLTTNWRSDAPLLGGLEYLMDGFEFGSAEVAFQAVSAAPDHQDSGLDGDGLAPVQIRSIDATDDDGASAAQLRRAVQNDLVGTVQALLSGSVTIESGSRRRPLEARDIAILTRSNADATRIGELLAGVGVPAASSSGDSVLESPAAVQWQILLQALERPSAVGPARACALGWFLPTTATELAGFGDDEVSALHDTLRAWRATLRRRGVPGLLAAARRGGLSARVLSRVGGERNLTDLDHVAELLQTLTDSTSPTVLLSAIGQAINNSGEDRGLSDVIERRIDRDDDAVQAMTIHSAKGLEFPVVLVPFLWPASTRSKGIPHAALDGRRLLDASWIDDQPKAKGRNGEIRGAAAAEQVAEDRRLLYVALTRARHRCIVWWARDRGTGTRPLSDLLDHRLGVVPLHSGHLAPLERNAPGLISVSAVPIDVAAPAPLPPPDAPPSSSAGQQGSPTRGVSEAWRHTFEPSWRIWSFTAILDRARDLKPHGRSDPRPDAVPVIGGADESTGQMPIPDDESTDPPEPIGTPLADAPAGAAFGTLIHRVLETADFTADPLDEHLAGLCETALSRHPMAIAPAELAAGLGFALRAPLGGPVGSFALTQLSATDRIDELEFHLPLGSLRAGDIASVLTETLDPDDPVMGWARRVTGSRHGRGPFGGIGGEFEVDLAGRLTGSIDLTFRVQRDAAPVYYIADYKSNRLSTRGAYRPTALAQAMADHHYPLQASLYLVALHRYLRWRLRDYDPAVHLGGVAYLFVRAMDPGADPGHGVFWWQPPTEAVLALDRVLASGQIGSTTTEEARS